MSKHSYNYVRLVDVEDNTSTSLKYAAYNMSIGNIPSYSTHQKEDYSKYFDMTRPVPPLGGRNTRRGQGYSSLSNYNTIP